MTNEEAAMCLAELGNTHRLSIFRYLVKAGHDGASVGDVQRQLGIPGSFSPSVAHGQRGSYQAGEAQPCYYLLAKFRTTGSTDRVSQGGVLCGT